LTFFISALLFEVKNKEQFASFQFYFAVQIFISSALIALIGLSKMMLSLSGLNLPQDIPLYNSSLSSDYNFYSLSNILGIISAIFILVSSELKKRQIILIQIVVFVLSLSIIFSTSRRGILFFSAFLALLALFQAGKGVISRYMVKARVFLLLFTGFIILTILYFYTYNSKALFSFKRSEFNTNFVNNTLFQLALQYGSFFGYDYETAIDFIPIKYDSRYPYTKWGRRMHKEVYPLSGENAKIVPEGSVGYLLDRNSEAHSWSGNAYILTDITKLYQDDCSAESEFEGSVYCYVSGNFNGDLVSIRSDGMVSGINSSDYDLDNRECWQKLQIKFNSETCPPQVVLYVGKYKAIDMCDLTGYVIFAHPESGSAAGTSATFKNFPPLDGNRNNIEVSFLPFLFRGMVNKTQNASDSILSQNKVMVTASRLNRWKYGMNIFLNEYSLKEKVFGKGFSYLKSFGTKFGEAELDYPHNPLIDSLLYSGISGFLIYIWFLLAGVIYYLKHSNMHFYFLCCYLIVGLFSIVSANTHFSVPVFALLSLIPFFSNYLQGRATSN
jgi:hypothetical protein